MIAAIIPAVGSEWLLREVPDPRPGPGDVLIRVRASGLCHNDILLTQGAFQFPALDPVIAGHEPAGEVVEVGAGVTSRRVGDRVGATWVQRSCGRCASCRRHPELTGQSGMSCPDALLTGLTAPGGQAEYISVPAASTVLLPDGLSYEAAASMLCAGYTAWSALRAAEPQPGDRVAVLGIGGLGHLAVQFARACGHETIAMTRTLEKHQAIRKLGAEHIVTDGAGLQDIGGADVILATGTSKAVAAEALIGLRANGRIVLTTLDPGGSFAIGPNHPLWFQRQRVIGSTHNGLSFLAEALELAAARAVTPLVEVFDKERVAGAVARAAQGAVRFRAVINY